MSGPGIPAVHSGEDVKPRRYGAGAASARKERLHGGAARGGHGRRRRRRPVLVGSWRPAVPELPRHRVGPAGGRGPAAVREAVAGGVPGGLSWLTIFRKRENFRRTFQGFDPAAVAGFGAEEVDRLLADPGIVRNRAKIDATVNNARRYADLVAEFGSLAAYVWRYEPGPQARPPVLDHAALLQLGQSPESKALSKDLRRRGWSFVGAAHRVRLHGGDGPRQRPSGGVRPPPGDRARTTTVPPPHGRHRGPLSRPDGGHGGIGVRI